MVMGTLDARPVPKSGLDFWGDPNSGAQGWDKPVVSAVGEVWCGSLENL